MRRKTPGQAADRLVDDRASSSHGRVCSRDLARMTCRLRLRSWPLFDPGRKQLHYFSDARGPQLGPAGCHIDPAQIGLAVELGQGVEERCSALEVQKLCEAEHEPAHEVFDREVN